MMELFDKNKHLFICIKCNSQWSTYPHEAKKNSFCQECIRKEKEMNLEKSLINEKLNDFYKTLTEKSAYVIGLIHNHPKMATREIIDEYSEYMEGRDSISPRHVQRLRKKYNKIIKKAVRGENKMVDDINDDEWDSEIYIINIANEGGWSVQDLALKFDKTPEEIREILKNNKDSIDSLIFDEEDNGVFFNSDSSATANVDIDRFGFPRNKFFDTIAVEEENQPKKSHDTPLEEEYWEVEIECVTACSKVEQEIDVYMSVLSREKAAKFMKWAKNREWLAYLVGEKINGKYIVRDLYLPDQRTSSTLVDKVVAENYNHMKVIGVIHSHHEMGAGDEDRPSFSGHDSNFINGNHDVSLLAGLVKNGNGKGFRIVGIGRVKTPCGSLMKVKANVRYLDNFNKDQENELKNEFFEKVFNKKLDENENKPKKLLFENGGSYHFTKNPTITKRG